MTRRCPGWSILDRTVIDEFPADDLFLGVMRPFENLEDFGGRLERGGDLVQGRLVDLVRDGFGQELHRPPHGGGQLGVGRGGSDGGFRRARRIAFQVLSRRGHGRVTIQAIDRSRCSMPCEWVSMAEKAGRGYHADDPPPSPTATPIQNPKLSIQHCLWGAAPWPRALALRLDDGHACDSPRGFACRARGGQGSRPVLGTDSLNLAQMFYAMCEKYGRFGYKRGRFRRGPPAHFPQERYNRAHRPPERYACAPDDPSFQPARRAVT